MESITIHPINALSDNYIWALVRDDYCVIVDPGEAEPALRFIAERGLSLKAILVTHHHWDHTNGIAEVLNHSDVPVYAGANDPVAACTHPLKEGDVVSIPELSLSLQVLDIPGHTLGHIALYNDEIAFTGDTLFTAGCGKIFEGTAEQMYASLQKLKTLPEATKVYCGHEYTEANLDFALKVEPDNPAVLARAGEVAGLRMQGKPTVPASMALERATNPFLRTQEPSVIRAAEQWAGHPLMSPVEVLAALRTWKNQG